MTKRQGDLLLLTAAVIGGFGIIGMKLLMGSGYGTFQMIAIRFLITTPLMFLCFHKRLKKTGKEEIIAGGIMGLFLFGMFAFMVLGLARTTAAINGFLINIHAAIVPFLVWALYRKRPTARVFLGGFLTVVGMAFMSLEADFTINIGAVLTVLGSLSFAAYVMVTEHYTKTMDPIRLTTFQDLSVFLYAGILALVLEGSLPKITGTDVFAFLIIGVLSTFLFFICQVVGQTYTSSTNAAIILSSESVFTALFARIFLGEALTLRILFGGSLILVAMILTQTEKIIDGSENIQYNENKSSYINGEG